MSKLDGANPIVKSDEAATQEKWNGSERVLVTGAAGFIGSHLCERLLDDSAEVWGLDNFDPFYDPELKRHNLREALSRPGFHFVEGDVRDGILLGGLLSDIDFDVVVHLAARPGVRPSLDEPAACFDSNVMGTITLLEAMRVHHVDRLVFGSSSSVYGRREATPFREEDAAGRPASPYAASKRSGELLCHTYHDLHGFSVFCLRLFTVYGPRQRPDLAIHKFAKLLTRGQTLPLYGDGTSARDYTFVDDTVDGIARAVRRLHTTEAEPEYGILNLGCGEPVQLSELVDTLGSTFGVEPKTVYLENQPGDVPVTHAATEKAEEMLEWKAETSLWEGLAAFAQWMEDDTDESRSDKALRPTAEGAA